MRKKILPLLIALVMVFGLFPAGVLAGEIPPDSSIPIEEVVPLSSLPEEVSEDSGEADVLPGEEAVAGEEFQESKSKDETGNVASGEPVVNEPILESPIVEEEEPGIEPSYFDESLWPEVIDGGPVSISLPQNGRARMAAASEATGQLTLRRYEGIRWNFNKTGSDVEERPWYLVDIDGRVAYCVEPNNPNTVSGTYGTISYDALSTDQKYAIGYAMLYGAQNTNDPLYHMATQLVIWEVVYGYLDLTTFQPTGSILYNNTIGYNAHNRQADVNYRQIFNDIRSHKQAPSFMSSVEAGMPGHALSGGSGSFEVTLTNTNPSVRLADFNFTNTAALTFTKNGENLTIHSNTELSGYAIAAYKGAAGYTDSLIYWGNGNNQVRATAGSLTPVPAYFRLSTQTLYASLELLKLDAQTGEPIEGVQFELSLDGKPLGTYTTDAEGKIQAQGLSAGVLTAVEVSPAPGYIPSDIAHEVVLERGKTAAITVANTKLAGLQLRKVDAASGLSMAGVSFAIYNADGECMGEYTTGHDGLITLEATFMPGTYTVCETATLPGYILDSTPYTVTLVAGGMETISIANTKLARLQLRKVCVASGLPMMDVHFAIYDAAGNFVGSYTTNENGLIDLEETFLPGEYTICETATRPGYILDTTPRKVILESGKTTTITWENQPVPVEVPRLPKTGAYV